MPNCAYCKTPMVLKADGELYCPKRRWYTLNLHIKTVNGFHAYPVDYDSFITYVCGVLRRIRYIF